MKPASSFRSKYAYDNLLYMAAGQIIPAVTGTSWDDYIRTRIFAPLAMKSSTVSTSSFKPDDNVAFPHSKIDGTLKVVPFQNLDNVGPAGAINSSAAEMSRWLLLQLNHGKFADRDERLFSEKQSKEMWAGQTILPIGTPPASLASLKANFAAYALGWGTRDYKGRKMVGHTGGVLRLCVPSNAGAGRKSGRGHTDQCGIGECFDSILFHIIDHYFGVAPTDWIAAFKANDDSTGSKLTRPWKRWARPGIRIENVAPP